MKNFSYKEIMKVEGIYNKENHSINVNGDEFDVVKMLNSFDSEDIEMLINIKDEKELIE